MGDEPRAFELLVWLALALAAAVVVLDDPEPPLEDGETPTPNNGGLAPAAEPPDPSCRLPDDFGAGAVSLRALETGIAYCLPAGEPGSMWTPG